VLAYQSILGSKQAATFVKSLQTLVEHLETRQRQLAAELQETTTMLDVFKRFAQDGGSLPDAAMAQLESLALPSLDSLEDEPEEEIADPPAKGRQAKTTKAPKATRKPGRRKKEAAEVVDDVASDTGKGGGFNPRKSMLRAYHGMMLRDVILQILQENEGEPVTADDMIYTIYGKNLGKDSFKKAKTVMTAELSKGKLLKSWMAAPGQRGAFMVNMDGVDGVEGDEGDEYEDDALALEED
jgi:hypothetical protein